MSNIAMSVKFNTVAYTYQLHCSKNIYTNKLKIHLHNSCKFSAERCNNWYFFWLNILMKYIFYFTCICIYFYARKFNDFLKKKTCTFS